MDADKPFLGDNPLYGAFITYRLATKPKEAPVLRIFDSQHALIQQFTGTADEGLNRVAWDLRYPTLVKATPEQRWAVATGFFYKSVQGPVVLPGDYSVELSVGAETKPVTLARPIHVDDDPTVTLSASDRAARQAAILRGFEMYKTGHDADRRYAAVYKALTAQTAALKDRDAPKPIQAALDTFTKQMREIEPLFMANPDPMNIPLVYVPPPVTDRIARVVFILENYTAAPRPQDTDQLDALVPIQKDALAKLQHLLEVDMVTLNRALHDANIPFLATPPTPMPTPTAGTDDSGQDLS